MAEPDAVADFAARQRFQTALAAMFYHHNYDRMSCADHDGHCCPIADPEHHDLTETQYEHYARLTIAVTDDVVEQTVATTRALVENEMRRPVVNHANNLVNGGSLCGARGEHVVSYIDRANVTCHACRSILGFEVP